MCFSQQLLELDLLGFLSMANSHFRPALEVEISHDKVSSNGTC